MKIGIIGTGRVGQTLAFALAHEEFVEQLHLVDVIEGLAAGVMEEVLHTTGSTGFPIEVEAYTDAGKLPTVDVIVVTAGKQRTADMTRRDLVEANSKIIASLGRQLSDENSTARYLVVTNPVDAMATLLSDFVESDLVLSSGTNLERLRFKAELSKATRAKIDDIEGYVGGEHGMHSIFLWSTVDIGDRSWQDYEEEGAAPTREDVEERTREVARVIIEKTGSSASLGPAASFRDILKAMALDEDRLLSVASAMDFGFEKEVHVTVPRPVGRSLGDDILGDLTDEEQRAISAAAESIWNTYQVAESAVA